MWCAAEERVTVLEAIGLICKLLVNTISDNIASFDVKTHSISQRHLAVGLQNKFNYFSLEIAILINIWMSRELTVQNIQPIFSSYT